MYQNPYCHDVSKKLSDIAYKARQRGDSPTALEFQVLADDVHELEQEFCGRENKQDSLQNLFADIGVWLQDLHDGDACYKEIYNYWQDCLKICGITLSSHDVNPPPPAEPDFLEQQQADIRRMRDIARWALSDGGVLTPPKIQGGDQGSARSITDVDLYYLVRDAVEEAKKAVPQTPPLEDATPTSPEAAAPAPENSDAKDQVYQQEAVVRWLGERIREISSQKGNLPMDFTAPLPPVDALLRHIAGTALRNMHKAFNLGFAAAEAQQCVSDHALPASVWRELSTCFDKDPLGYPHIYVRATPVGRLAYATDQYRLQAIPVSPSTPVGAYGEPLKFLCPRDKSADVTAEAVGQLLHGGLFEPDTAAWVFDATSILDGIRMATSKSKAEKLKYATTEVILAELNGHVALFFHANSDVKPVCSVYAQSVSPLPVGKIRPSQIKVGFLKDAVAPEKGGSVRILPLSDVWHFEGMLTGTRWAVALLRPMLNGGTNLLKLYEG